MNKEPNEKVSKEQDRRDQIKTPANKVASVERMIKMNFINADHHLRFNILTERDHTHEKDIERRAMFYIFAGVEDLFSKINHLYDFGEQIIMPETLKESRIDLTSSMRALVKLGFNLYNGYESDNFRDTFSVLDETNRYIAIEALKYRFRIETPV